VFRFAPAISWVFFGLILKGHVQFLRAHLSDINSGAIRF
jgi:hypothetical protein